VGAGMRLLALAVVAVAVAACGGGSTSTVAPSGAASASKAPAICVNVASLRTTVEQLTSMDPAAAGMVSVRLAANNVATQTATFVSGAPADLRAAAQGLKDAIAAVRVATATAGAAPADAAAAIAGVDASWKEFEAKLAALCPSQQ
jgi:hypothetical protein